MSCCPPASGNRTLTYSLAANTSTTSRTATFFVDFFGNDYFQLLFTLTQAGAAAQAIALGSTSLIFNAQQGGSNPFSQAVSISNSGGGTLNWTATATTQTGGSWLSVSPTSGTNTGTLTVSVNTAGLTAGGSPYRGTIQVTDPTASNSPETIAVTLNISLLGSLAVAPTTLSFSAPAATAAVPAQQITISGAVAGANWSASTQSVGNWLSVLPASGTIPGTVSVGVSVGALTPGTYRGTITVQAPSASATQTINVDLTVQPAAPPQLSVQPSSLTLEVQLGATSAPSQTLRISNAGSGTLNWTAQASTLAGQSRLRVSPASGSASAAAPATALLQVDPTGLGADVYSASVVVASSTTGEGKTVPLTLVVSQATPTILVSQSGLLFTAVAGGPALSQAFGILNTGRGTMPWTAQASTLDGGTWLSVSPASGTSTAGSLVIPVVNVVASVGQLPAGQYSGLIRVDAPGATNTPQFVTVHLNVLPAGNNPGVPVQPTGLIFAAPAGGSSPSQTVRLATAGTGSTQATVGVQTLEGGNWLSATPSTATVSSSVQASISIQATAGSLPPAIYRGLLTVQFDDGSPTQVVNVLLVVASAAAASGASPSGADFDLSGSAAAACVPQRLAAVYRTLGSSLALLLGAPITIEVQVADDCGTARSEATVVSTFSSGDPELKLASLGNGVYSATWRPVSPPGNVTVTTRASLLPLAAGEVVAQRQIGANPSAKTLLAGGIVNAASFASSQALAPGSIVAVFGQNMAAASAGATSLPLPTTLGGASLTAGNLDAPLFFASQGQINAQLPFDLPPNSRQQVLLKARVGATGPLALAVPETITVAAVSPGIFTTNSSGRGQGEIVIATTGEVAAPSGSVPGRPARPARGGDFISIYCAGLGDVTNRPPNGAAASSNPLSQTLAIPTVTIGGVSAPPAQFSGLAPFFAGLYQVNVQVPTNAPVGDAVEVVLTIGGVSSNAATMAVQ